MRGVFNILNYWRHASANKILVGGLFAIAIGLTTGFLLYQQPATRADAQNPSQCNQWKIMRCGMNNKQHMKSHWQQNHQGDMRAVYKAFGANANEAASKGQWGTVDRSGKVKVNGRVVATNAQTVYRNNNPNPSDSTRSIAGKTYRNQAVPDTLRFYGKSQDRILVVTDNSGKFKYGVLKNCGNPVSAHPTPQPKPEPKPEPKPQPKPEPQQPKPVKVCNPKTGKVITVPKNRADKFEPRNSEACKPKPQQPKPVKVCNPETGKIITVPKNKADDYEPRNSKECKPQPKPEPKPQIEEIKVCDAETGDILTVPENQVDDYLPVGAPECQDAIICNPETGETMTVPQNRADEFLPADAEECQEEQPAPTPKPEAPAAPTAPETIPETGPGQIIGGAVGLSSVAGASYYFAVSRRNLLGSVFEQ